MSRKLVLKERDRAIQEVLVHLFRILLCSGKNPAEVRAYAFSCIEAARREFKQLSLPGEGGDAQDFGSILRTWHKSAKYLSADGHPRALPLAGKYGLRGLIGTYFPKSQNQTVFSKLRAAGLIRENERGLWVPTEKYAVFPLLDSELLGHLSEGVSRLVETVISNVTAERKEDILFERSAKVRRFPANESSAFREFVKNQAIAFLAAVDDWMEAREEAASGSRAKKCTAGVFTFAFMDKFDGPPAQSAIPSPTRIGSR